MELRHLRYFVLVAEELHFGRAAERAGITQPPLSQQIRSLEAELGVRLFNRTKRHVELTDAGRALLPEARETLRQAACAEQAARDGASGATGRLSIAFAGSLAFSFLPRFVREYRQRFPGIRLSLREMTSEQQRGSIVQGSVDLGLVRYPILDPEFESKLIYREPILFAVNYDHRLAAEREPVNIASLAGERFVMFPREYGPPFFDQVMSLCRETGFTPHIAQEAVHMSTIVSLVGAGLGIALVPSSLESLGIADVEFRELRDHNGNTPEAEVHAIRLAGNRSRALDHALEIAGLVSKRH